MKLILKFFAVLRSLIQCNPEIETGVTPKLETGLTFGVIDPMINKSV